MVRLCLSLVVLSAASFVSEGCSGQNIEGSWLGALPVEEAKECRINIYSDHRFDVSCGSLEWVGAGRYERFGDRLALHFSVWVHRGQPQRVRPDMKFVFQGEGNTLQLGDAENEPKTLTWKRAPL